MWRSWVLALGVVGCAEDPGDDLMAGQVGPPGAVLTAGPAIPGQLLDLVAEGVEPGATVQLWWGREVGPGLCIPELGGGCLGLVDAALFRTAVADPNGVARWSFRLPTSAPLTFVKPFEAVALELMGGVSTGPLAVEVVNPIDACDRLNDGGFVNTDASLECDVLYEVNLRRAVGGSCGGNGYYPPTFPVTMNASLREAARTHAQWQADANKLSHKSPGGPLGDTFIQRAENAGYTPWRRLTENVARGQTTAAAVVADWIASPDHCKNLLASNVRDIGIGRGITASGGAYWSSTQGEPR